MSCGPRGISLDVMLENLRAGFKRPEFGSGILSNLASPCNLSYQVVEPNMPHQTHHLFLSYSRLDNKPQGTSKEGWITAFYNRLQSQHKLYTGRELRIFFDTEEIDHGSDWKARLGQGLRTSNLFLAFLSPNYMRSKNCRWEWEEYLRREHSLARGDDGIRTVFFEIVPGMPGISKMPEYNEEKVQAIENELRADQEIARWLNMITEEFRRRNNYFDQANALNPRATFDLQPWFSKGPQILSELDASERLDQLRADPQSDKDKIVDLAERLKSMDEHIATRLDRCLLADLAPGRFSLGRTYPHFVGRHRELRELHQSLISDKVGVVTAVHGLGGQGKTALAVQYAHAYADFYAAGGRWLVPCEGVNSLADALMRLAGQVELRFDVPKEVQNDPEQTIGFVLLQLERYMEQNAERIMAKLRQDKDRMSSEDNLPQLHPRALVIFDNVDHPDLVSAEQLKLLPQSEWFELVVTTRLDPEKFGVGKDLRPIAVDSLPIDDAVALIRDFQPNQQFPSSQYDEGVKRLCEELGCFTLAVEIVGAFLADHPEVDPNDYCTRLTDEGLATAEGVLAYEGVAPNIRHQQKYLSKVIDTTLEKLEERARFVLDHAAILEPDSVVMDWIREIAAKKYPELRESQDGGSQQFVRDRPDAWADIWRQLSGRRLITEGAERPEIKEVGAQSKFSVPAVARIHRVVAAHVQKSMDESTLLQAVKNIAEVFEKRALDFESRWEHDPSILWGMRPFGDNAIYLAKGYPQELAFAIGCGVFGQAELIHGSLSNAIELSNQCASDLTAAYGKNSHDQRVNHMLSFSHITLGDIYRERIATGTEDLALGHFQESLVILRQLTDTNPNSVKTQRSLSLSLNKLADFYLARSKSGDAELALGHFEESLKIARLIAQALPNSTTALSHLSVSLIKLGNFYRARGKSGDAELALGHFTESLDIRRQIAEAFPNSTKALSDLCVSLECLGVHHWLAELRQEYLRKSLDFRRHIAEANPNSARAKRDLSLCLYMLGDFHNRRNLSIDYEFTMEYYREALEIYRQLANMAPHSRQALRDLSLSLDKLGRFHFHRDKTSDTELAIRYFQESLRIDRKNVEANIDSGQAVGYLRRSLITLGDFYLNRNDFGDAELALQHFQESIEITNQLAIAKPKSAYVLRDLNLMLERLCDLFRSRGESRKAELTAQAIANAQRLIDQWINKLGSAHEDSKIE